MAEDAGSALVFGARNPGKAIIETLRGGGRHELRLTPLAERWVP